MALTNKAVLNTVQAYRSFSRGEVTLTEFVSLCMFEGVHIQSYDTKLGIVYAVEHIITEEGEHIRVEHRIFAAPDR